VAQISSVEVFAMNRVAAALTMFLLVALPVPPSPIHAQAQDPGAVVQAFETAARAGDLDRALSLLAENAVVTGISGRAYTGREEIRARLIDARAHGEYLMEGPGPRTVTANRVVWSQYFFAEDLRDLGVAPMLVNAEAVVEGGRITRLAYRPSAESEQRLRIATSAQETMINLQQAMATHNLPAAIALFADDAIAQTPQGLSTGRAEVQGWLEELFRQGFAEQITGPRQVTGDRVIQNVEFGLDLFKLLGFETLRARVEATIPEGRISRLNVFLDPDSETRFQTAMNTAVVVRFLNDINAGNLGVIDELLAPDYVNRDAEPGVDAGIEGTRQFFTMMRAGFPDVRFSPALVIAASDLVAVRLDITGTNTGTMIGLPPTGARVVVPAIDILRVRNGVIVEHWGVADEATLLRQLGIMPAMDMAP
jgi:predicted ester cyclase/ketosteroid isomerase-like protein